MKQENIQQYMEYNDDRFTKRVIYKENKDTVFVLNFKPGQKLPEHKHPGSNVHLHVIEGEGEFTFDGSITPAVQGDVFFVNGDENLSFSNNSLTNTSIHVILSKTPDDSYAQDV
ncbi:hypothetical protein JNUCC1_02480 [Lentibacillus sp. JNUCC-1]|uniref:cupin domain-containing protein n=1 Tax=Lentibacillus sp. JNUCC-1 TaxID=2654513 RepID=UPI0012E80F3A|nr:cupin domain-containing protein [Lentibacillus sp. JNUCC-1]MUV38626.1 hypothetical protein [Lentibacillus sp. JNUCC-1]